MKSSIRTKLMPVFLLIATSGMFQGCVTDPPPTLPPFNAAEAQLLLQTGNNTITGNAFLRQQGGGVVTAAGSEVSLIPATEYATARMRYLFGNTYGGFNKSKDFGYMDKNYEWLMQNTVADSQGNFSFENIADGTFYLTTNITWYTGYSYQGGAIMRRVEVRGGETKKIVLTQ